MSSGQLDFIPRNGDIIRVRFVVVNDINSIVVDERTRIKSAEKSGRR